MSKVLDEFKEGVLLQALQFVDKDAIAKKLAKKIQEETEKGAENFFDEFDFQYYISEELNDQNSAAGKAFNKALTGIAKRMADAIKP